MITAAHTKQMRYVVFQKVKVRKVVYAKDEINPNRVIIRGPGFPNHCNVILLIIM